MAPSPSPSGFISTKDAAKNVGYSADYLARLARAGEVRGVQSGRIWFVDLDSLTDYLAKQKIKKQERLEELSRTRVREYHGTKQVPASITPLYTPVEPVLSHEVMPPELVEGSTLSPFSSSIRASSWVTNIGALVAAGAVIAAGIFVGDTSLLPTMGTRSLALAQTASGGFTQLIEPLRTSVGRELATLRSTAQFGNKNLAALTKPEERLETRPPPLFLSKPETPKADLTSNQAVKSVFGDPHELLASRPLQDSVMLLARAGGGFVRIVHRLIAGEVGLAYAVPQIAPKISSAAVYALGEIGTSAFGATRSSAYGLRDIGAVVGGGASVAIEGMAKLAIGVSEHGSSGARMSIAAAYTGLYQEAAMAKKEVATGVHVTKNTLQNIVSTAHLAISRLGKKAPTAEQAAVATAHTVNESTSKPEAPPLVPVPGSEGLPVVVAVPVSADTLSYGDLIDYDASTGVYRPSAKKNDPSIYGVAVERPPVLLAMNDSGIPVMERGRALVNVTLENGPIEPGDPIAASSIPGKGMKAASGSQNVVGIAREAFTGVAPQTASTSNEKVALSVGTIMVDITAYHTAGSASKPSSCASGQILCAIASKVSAASLVSLLRYLIAAAIALGALYLAFRTFMADAVSGVTSVGRNPRAKASIQAMVFFNGVLAVGIALAGLAAAIIIMFINV